MYITWKYDLYPYELCAKMIKCKGNNFYEVEGYGKNSFEAKRKIKDDTTGEEVKRILQDAEKSYRHDRAELERKHINYITLRLTIIHGLK